MSSRLLDEVVARVGDRPPGDGQLAELARWLPEAAAGLDLAAARAEAARTGRSAVVAYRPDGPVLGLGWFPPGDTVWWRGAPGDVHRQTGTGDGAVELVLLARDHLTPTQRAARCLGTLAYDSLAQLYAPDVVLDADVPHWRFQMRGGAGILETLRHEELALPGLQVTSFRWTETVDGGLVAQREVRFDGDGGPHQWRDVHVLRREGGWITEHALSCTGIWDPATIARQAVEAPMVVR